MRWAPSLRTKPSPRRGVEDSRLALGAAGQEYSAFAMRMSNARRSARSSLRGPRTRFGSDSRPSCRMLVSWPSCVTTSKGSRRVMSAQRTTPHAQASVSRPSYGRPVTSSGAAYDSEPQRVVSKGDAGSMKRERPKSVSLIRGAGDAESVNTERVRRMSATDDVSTRQGAYP